MIIEAYWLEITIGLLAICDRNSDKESNDCNCEKQEN